MDVNRRIGDSAKWVAPAVVVAALVVGATSGLGPALLVLAGGVLTGVVLLFWSSIGRLTGESPLSLEEAIGLGAPSPEEERKRSILRALKDLEYERSVGKISEEDFAELSARYRAEAKTLLKLIDAESAPMRKRAEERLAARLRDESGEATPRKSKKGKSTKKAEPSPPAPKEIAADAPVSAVPAEETARAACPSCSTSNDADAAFCKRCGVALGKPAGVTS
ncbi:MAG TPA: zinc ribbon domain-containing protein [Polyangiaceae bacterium]|nr:zinc ribbon domain-containing protein [Polyangiaceae bacterium]